MTSTPASPSADACLGESTSEVWPRRPFQRVPQQPQEQVFVPPPQALTTCEAVAASAEAQAEEVRVGKEVQAGQTSQTVADSRKCPAGSSAVIEWEAAGLSEWV